MYSLACLLRQKPESSTLPWWDFPFSNLIATICASLPASSGCSWKCYKIWCYRVSEKTQWIIFCDAVQYLNLLLHLLLETLPLTTAHLLQARSFCIPSSTRGPWCSLQPETYRAIFLQDFPPGESLKCCKVSSGCWRLYPVAHHHCCWGWVWWSEQDCWPLLCVILYDLLPNSLVLCKNSSHVPYFPLNVEQILKSRKIHLLQVKNSTYHFYLFLFYLFQVRKSPLIVFETSLPNFSLSLFLFFPLCTEGSRFSCSR